MRNLVQCAAICATLLNHIGAHAQLPRETYQRPDERIVAAMDLSGSPFKYVSPDGRWVLIGYLAGPRSIDDLLRPTDTVLRWRFDRASGTLQQLRLEMARFELFDVAHGTRRQVLAPLDGFGAPLWSPDSRRFLMWRITNKGAELWVGTLADEQAKPLPDVRPAFTVRDGFSVPCEWLPDSRHALCRTIPANRVYPREESVSASGPTVLESNLTSGPLKIYSSFLRGEHDERLYEYYFRTQPALVDVVTGSIAPISEPGIFEQLSPSPNGRYILAVRTLRPYSHSHYYERFPKRVEILDRSGRLVGVLGEFPLDTSGDELNGWTSPFPRRFEWIPTAANSLVFIEPLDAGDPRRAVPHRDRLMLLKAPFDGAATELFRAEFRMAPYRLTRWFEPFANIGWASNDRAWVEEYDVSTQRKRVWLIDVAGSRARLVNDFSVTDAGATDLPPILSGSRYHTLGNVLAQDGEWIYLGGDGVSVMRGARRVAVERLSLSTLRREPLHYVSEGFGEYWFDIVRSPNVALLNAQDTVRQARRLLMRELNRKEVKRIDVEAVGANRERRDARLISYLRDDGVRLEGLLFLPDGYTSTQRLPVVIDAYPLHYGSAEAASAVRDPGVTWAAIPAWMRAVPGLTTQGYAVLLASMPIVHGAAQRTECDQIVANAMAAVRELDRIGVADLGRIGVFGHSRGGRMVATLLGKSDLFAAGIAVSGSYNKTNTPFGEPDDPRTLWAAVDDYMSDSPLFYADRIRAPLLLIHGRNDDNFSTQPVESERMFYALSGLGKTTRLVMLPGEVHQPRALESALHVAWEIETWFNRYLKRPASLQTTAGDTTGPIGARSSSN